MLQRLRLVPLLALAPLAAQGLIRDINTAAARPNGDSNPAEFAVVRTLSRPLVLFQATTLDAGAELWKTDGTLNSGSLVRDIRPGPESSAPSDLFVVGNDVYFAADDGVHGRELWRSDGVRTELVADIHAGPGDSTPGQFILVGATVFFTADDGVHGAELWRTDGTPQGTVMVADIRPGGGGSAPSWLRILYETAGPRLIFTADDGSTGAEPWRSDGTASGTTRIADIRPGRLGSNPRDYTPWFGSVFFVANDGISGTEIWQTFGDAQSTHLSDDINPGSGGSNPRFLVSLRRRSGGTVLLMSAYRPDVGTELYQGGDFTVNHEFLRDIRPGGNPSVPTELTKVGDDVYFAADDGSNGRELWLTDGTAAGTRPVRDIRTGPEGSSPAQLTAVGSRLFFRAEHTAGLVRVWISEGTAATTRILTNSLNSGRPSGLVAFGLWVLYANDDPVYGREPHLGTPTSEDVLVDIEGSATLSSSPVHLGNYKGKLIFSATQEQTGRELWSSDGTAAGTVRLTDIGSLRSSTPALLGQVDGELLFSADDVRTGRELWKTDGTPAGTVLVREIGPGTASGVSSLGGLAVGGRVLFFGDDGSTGNELWSSDGTANGTGLVVDIYPGARSSLPRDLAAVGSAALFFATDPTSGRELWRTDGTAAGTTLVRDIRSGSGGGAARQVPHVVHGGRLYFAADDGVHGTELWVSDGTAAGTFMVHDLEPGSASSSPEQLTSVGSLLFFAARTAAHGFEPWKSDGTAAGTAVFDIGRTISDGLPAASANLVGSGGLLFFAGADGEPWRCDGTFAGTYRLADIWVGGPSMFDPSGNVHIASAGTGGRVVFRARDSADNYELWTSDGTTAGTRLVRELVAGPGAGSSPTPLATLGDAVFLAADDGVHGEELWRLPLGELGASNVETYGDGCPGARGVPLLGYLGEPRIGRTTTAVVTAARPGAPGAILLGAARQSLPLPGGCWLLVQPAVFLGIATDADGRADLPLPIALVPDWLGVSLFEQAVVADPAGSLFGAVAMTAGQHLVIGR